MANEEDDLFEDEFDFVDEDDSEVEENSAEENTEENSEVEQEEPTKPKRRSAKASDSKSGGKRGAKKKAAAEDDTADDDGKKEDAEAEPEEAAEPPGPPADHLVHVYEHGNFKRTIPREFTDEDSIKFAEEFNRTSKSYGRRAVPDHRDEKPDPHL